MSELNPVPGFVLFLTGVLFCVAGLGYLMNDGGWKGAAAMPAFFALIAVVLVGAGWLFMTMGWLGPKL